MPSSSPETYIIFITKGDIFGANKALYHIDRIVKETKKSFGDEAHIIYVNSKIQNNAVLGRLMHDFYCTDAKDIKNRKLAKRVNLFDYSLEELQAVHEYWRSMNRYSKQVLNKEKVA